MVEKSSKRKVSKQPTEVLNSEADLSSNSLKPKESIFVKLLPVLYVAVVLMSFGFGTIWEKVNSIGKVQQTTNQPTQTTPPTPKPVSMDLIKGLFDKDVIKFGNKDSKLIFVEVADPSCPFCHVASGGSPKLASQIGSNFVPKSAGGTYLSPVLEMKKLLEEGKASYIYIYAPGHGAGEVAQRALYCANEKGKYWEAHNLIYSDAGYDLVNNVVKNDKTKAGEMATFLKAVVDQSFLKTCIESSKYDSRLASDTQIANIDLEVFGTPGFFVNNVRFPGAISFSQMESTVKSAL